LGDVILISGRPRTHVNGLRKCRPVRNDEHRPRLAAATRRTIPEPLFRLRSLGYRASRSAIAAAVVFEVDLHREDTVVEAYLRPDGYPSRER
jgi:hypothetical protein